MTHPNASPEMPRWARALLQRLCAPRWREEIEGDLEELFAIRVREQGEQLARLLFVKDVLLFIRPYVVRRTDDYRPARGPIMFKNYTLVALRNLRKYQLYSFINVLGLAVGIAVCTLLFLFVRHEWSYDQFHTNKDRLYRLAVTYKETGDAYSSRSSFAAPVGPALAADYAEVEEAVRVWYTPGSIMQRGETLLAQSSAAVDPAFLQVFSFDLLRGDPATALNDPTSVVLTESVGRRFFGNEDPMGQDIQIQIDGVFESFTVTGMMADVPEASSIQFGLLLPFSRVSDIKGEDVLNEWDDSFVSTFVLLRLDASPATVDAKLPGFVTQYYGHWFEGFRNRGIQGADGDLIRYWLQPLDDIRLNDAVQAQEPTSTPLFNYLLMGIALFILVIACINFVNLAIARAASRMKEIGVRKAMGAVRGQLMQQFWGEAILLSALAAVLGTVLAALFLPIFNDLADKALVLDLGSNVNTLLMLVALTLGVGLLAGGYPALMLSGFRPVEVLRGRLPVQTRQRFGKGLIVFQFALSVTLIVTTVLVAQQVDYLRNRSVGFETEQIVVIPTFTRNDDTPYQRYRDVLLREPNVVAVTGSSLPMSFFRSRRSTVIGETRFQSAVARVDYNFLETMGLSLVAGRDFSQDFGTDATQAVVVNERFVRRVGWTPEEALGQTFPFYGDTPVTIIGVIKDFHITSLHTPIEPTILHVNPIRAVRFVFAEIQPTQIPETVAMLETQWHALYPSLPFSYGFMDQRLARQYAFEERISTIMWYSTFFATLVACLGLFGLSALSVARRTKEIGIRKVLGASSLGIVRVLSRQFVGLVLLANLVAWPLAYWATQQLLQNHAYRIDIGVTVFVVTGVLSIVLAVLTVSYQSIRAAVANPVEALRYE